MLNPARHDAFYILDASVEWIFFSQQFGISLSLCAATVVYIYALHGEFMVRKIRAVEVVVV